MMLLQPIMLAWIAGAMVPLVLHLLSQSRYHAVPWGAMMFLHTGTTHWYQTAKARQLLLLIIRMITVGTLVMALARPVIAARHQLIPTAGLTVADRAAVVIILDDSASMGYQHEGQTRLDQGRQVALQILSALKRGDQATLLLAGCRDNPPAAPPGVDLQSIATRLADLQPDIGQADFASELNRAADLLSHNPATQRQIFLICDTQASSWRNLPIAFKQTWHTAGASLSTTIIPVGQDQSDNISVDAIDIQDNTFIREQPTQVQVRVHNYASTSQPSVPLSVWSGARTIAQTQVSIPPRSIRSVAMNVRFAEPGTRVISAAITTTGLTTDDRLDVAAEVIEPYRVLFLQNPPAASQPATQPADRWHSETSIISLSNSPDWSADNLHQYQVLVLDDIAEFSLEQANIIRDFLSAGRGVLFLPGPHSNIENYNRILFQAGHGVLPAALRAVAPKIVGIGNLNRQHPVFHLGGLLRSDSIQSELTLGAHQPSARVIGRLSNTEPWCIESTTAHCRVLMLTGGQALLQSTAGQPLLQSILRYLGGGTAIDRNLTPGQPLILQLNQEIDQRSATVQAPAAATREPAVVTQTPNHTEIRYLKTQKPGTYRLRYRSDGSEKILNYVVTNPPVDSDLTPLTQNQWQTLSDRFKFEKIDLSRTTVAAAMEQQRGGREIWIDLLGTVLLLMCAEMVLSRAWST